MPLNRAIQNLIANADFGQADTIRKCRELGMEIDKSTLSKMVHGKIKEPNLEKLEVIAKACNGDMEKLLIEMDFDHSPQRIKDILINLKLKSSNVAKNFIENEFDEETEKKIKRSISNEPIADFLMSLSNLKESDMDINKLFVKEDNEAFNKIMDNKFSNLNISLGITIADNGMNPIVPKDSKVTIQLKNEYQINDIILVNIIKDNKFVARYVKIEDDKIFLYGINKNTKIEEYKKNEVIFLGKIVSVTINI